jgi:hypothetical protein
MPRRYEKKIIPFQVVIRMPVEAVARCWHNNLTADDIGALAPGERMRPARLWPRPPDRGRTRTMWYWIATFNVNGVNGRTIALREYLLRFAFHRSRQGPFGAHRGDACDSLNSSFAYLIV